MKLIIYIPNSGAKLKNKLNKALIKSMIKIIKQKINKEKALKMEF